MDTSPIDNGWALAALLGSTFITALFGWLTLRAKGASDDHDEPATEAIEKVQEQEDLRPIVDTLARRLGEMEAEMSTYRTVVKIRYPLSLSVIRHYQQRYRDAGVHIPPEIREDL